MPDMENFEMGDMSQGGDMQIPDNMQIGQMPNGNEQDRFGNTSSALSSEMTLLLISVSVLAIGLVFAILFKRRK